MRKRVIFHCIYIPIKVLVPQAKKDAKKIASSGLKPKVQELLKMIEIDPH